MKITVKDIHSGTHIGDGGGFHSDGSFFLHEPGEEHGTGWIYSKDELVSVLIELDKAVDE